MSDTPARADRLSFEPGEESARTVALHEADHGLDDTFADGSSGDYDGGEDAASTLVLIGDSDLKLIERLMVGDSVMAHHF